MLVIFGPPSTILDSYDEKALTSFECKGLELSHSSKVDHGEIILRGGELYGPWAGECGLS